MAADTEYSRDYSEGAAYRAYFATDELMFDVAHRDGRLPNKAEVLVMRSAAPDGVPLPPGANTPPFAISTNLLRERHVLHTVVGDTNIVVITSTGGANRAYAAGIYRFVETDGNATVRDAEARDWIVGEDSLEAAFDSRVHLPRISAHRSFWFAWYTQHPDTLLIE